MDRWEGAKVSTQVASQTNNLPFDQGTIVIPSGRLPSVRSRPVGSSREGTLADDKALCMQNVIKHGMAEVTTSTKTTTEPMRAECVHICTTVITKVRDAKWGSQTKANRYANSVIIHAKTQGSN